MRNRPAQILALGFVCPSAASIMPVNRTGHEAFERLHILVDDPGVDWMDAHMDRAEKATLAFYGLALQALGAVTASKALATQRACAQPFGGGRRISLF